MWFAVPQTSRRGQVSCPRSPLRTHALCGKSSEMARPKKHEKRDKQLNLKFTPREFVWLRRKAEGLGMKPGEYGRMQVLAERPVSSGRQAVPHLDPLFLAALSRIGNNLNQIARRLNQLQIEPPSTLEPLLQAIREMIGKASSDDS